MISISPITVPSRRWRRALGDRRGLPAAAEPHGQVVVDRMQRDGIKSDHRCLPHDWWDLVYNSAQKPPRRDGIKILTNERYAAPTLFGDRAGAEMPR